ncbi:MAG TPA: SlyX family protein [Solimonas sp.]
MNDDDRLVALETKLAFQEETLRVLNDVVTAQQERIERLEQICRQLAERVIQQAGEGGFKGTLADEVPPHY